MEQQDGLTIIESLLGGDEAFYNMIGFDPVIGLLENPAAGRSNSGSPVSACPSLGTETTHSSRTSRDEGTLEELPGGGGGKDKYVVGGRFKPIGEGEPAENTLDATTLPPAPNITKSNAGIGNTDRPPPKSRTQVHTKKPDKLLDKPVAANKHGAAGSSAAPTVTPVAPTRSNTTGSAASITSTTSGATTNKKTKKERGPYACLICGKIKDDQHKKNACHITFLTRDLTQLRQAVKPECLTWLEAKIQEGAIDSGTKSKRKLQQKREQERQSRKKLRKVYLPS